MDKPPSRPSSCSGPASRWLARQGNDSTGKAGPPDSCSSLLGPAVQGLIAALLLTGLSPLPVTADKPVSRGLTYLFKQQSADGAWRPAKYKALADGPSLTAYTIHVTLSLPEPLRRAHAAGLRKGIAYLVEQLKDPRQAGISPNYSRAYLLRILVRTGRRPELRKRLVALLREAQLTEGRGWARTDLAYGAWDMGGVLHQKPLYSYLNISVTRVVLEALRAAGVRTNDPLISKARLFVERCQNMSEGPDRGGFCFRAAVPAANKAGWLRGTRPKRFVSYGTASTDGLRALVSCDADKQRIALARTWLAKNSRTDHVPGFWQPVPRNWKQGMLHYYLSGLSATTRSPAARQALRALQKADGRWQAQSALMMEDDPLLATALALEGLGG